jgi:hypothetical protein
LSIYLEAQRKSNSLAKGNRKKMAEYSRLGSNRLIIILRKLQFLFLFKYLVFSKQKPFSIIFPFSKLVNWHFIQNFGNCQNELGTQIFVFGLPKLQIEQFFFFFWQNTQIVTSYDEPYQDYWQKERLANHCNYSRQARYDLKPIHR